MKFNREVVREQVERSRRWLRAYGDVNRVGTDVNGAVVSLADDLARAIDVLREVASVDGRSRISPSAINNARALLAEVDGAVDIVTGGGR